MAPSPAPAAPVLVDTLRASRRHRPRKPRPALPAPEQSARLLLRLAARDVAMFRFLLEAYDNLAAFTVLERRPALLKVFFSPHQEEQVRRALADISQALPLEILPWPLPPVHRGRPSAADCAKML
ncbi:MAG: DUF4911 domain-containing protein [Desulfovibrionaceae bacterium]|nr:DUF4911 domain-containing protein [Desulfovibrionaceae bacterium]